MAWTDYGLGRLGSWTIGSAPTNPLYIALGQGNSAFVGSENYLNNELFREAVSWNFFQGNPQATVTIPTTSANGSILNEFGLAASSSLGSDLDTRNLSAIGSKNNTFDVNLSLTTKYRRRV